MMTSRIRSRIAGTVLTVMLSLVVSACMPVPAADDNAEISFVRQAVPKLLGRKAKGADEVEALADISQLLGREAVIRLLMAQPEFVSHWAEVLVDDLRVQREGGRLQPAGCLGPPLRVGGQGQPISDNGQLAKFVRDNPPTAAAAGGAFNMSDLIRSAIELDDLSPIYRAYPIPLTNKADFTGRTGVGDAFNHVFLTHQIDCLMCHNSQASTTNSPQWQRTHAIPIALEDAVYGCTSCTPDTDKAKTYAVFREDQLGGIQPWGMSASCGTVKTTLPNDPQNVSGFFAGASGMQIGLLTVDGKFKSGSDTLKQSGLARLPAKPGETLPQVAGDAGYAYMVAVTISQNVWREVTGELLTIANYYPRNADQMNALWHLTEVVFIPSGWSLKTLLTKIVTMSPGYFNRKAPYVGSGTTPYQLPMLFDPWVQNDPRVPPETDMGHVPSSDPDRHNNSIGEMVHRYSPRSLLYSVHAALDWPPPRRQFSTNTIFPSYADNAYPNAAFQKGIGQYVSDAQQGTRGVDFQGLLSWETQFGTCQKPPGVTTDWIDRLVGGIGTFDANNPGFPLTVADLVITMKDWLIQEPNLSGMSPQGLQPPLAETTGLFNHFGVTLNTTASTVPNLAAKLRGLCGVLAETPQFMLAGIVPQGGFSVPRYRVCNGQPCTYGEMCQLYKGSLAALGQYINCGNRTVTPGSPPPKVDVGIIKDFCPKGLCGFIPWPAIYPCIKDPKLCILPDLPPPCDPRCFGPNCCGDPPFDVRRPGIFLGYAEGMKVDLAQGARILRRAGKAFEPLKPGDTLRFGDIIEVPPGARFAASGAAGAFRTPSGGMISKTLAIQRTIDSELLAAVEAGKTVSAGALLSKGADVNAVDRFGESALMKAAQAGNREMIELLIRHGANVHAEDSAGLTAFDWAVLKKQRGTSALLRERGSVPKPEATYKKAPPRTEEPWVFMVTGPSLLKARAADPKLMTGRQALELNAAGKLGTQSLDIRKAQERWKAASRYYRGEGGALPDPKEAEAAVKRYMEQEFKKRGF
jgi:hypothetical protein